MNKAGETVASVDVPMDRYIFFATEDAGVDVPIVNKKRMCRNGCCTTCAVKVLEGKVRAPRTVPLQFYIFQAAVGNITAMLFFVLQYWRNLTSATDANNSRPA